MVVSGEYPSHTYLMNPLLLWWEVSEGSIICGYAEVLKESSVQNELEILHLERTQGWINSVGRFQCHSCKSSE